MSQLKGSPEAIVSYIFDSSAGHAHADDHQNVRDSNIADTSRHSPVTQRA